MADLTWTRFRASSAGAELAPRAKAVDVEQGARILRGGDTPDAIRFIESGIVRVFHEGGQAQFTAKLLRAPVVMGLVEVVNRSRWIGSVEALTPVQLVEVPAGPFREALARDLALSSAVLQELADKFEGTMRVSRSLGFDDAERRLIRVLLEYAEQFGRAGSDGVAIRFALTRERLVRELGVPRRTLDRNLRGLRDQKIAWLSPKGWLVISSLDALRARLSDRP